MENELDILREKIDKTDKELVRLFQERMNIAADVAAYKDKNGLPVLDSRRERAKLASIAEMSDEKFSSYTRVLYSLIFELSRGYQNKLLRRKSALYDEILSAAENTEKVFPYSPVVACQGTEGAYSQIACDKLFRDPKIMYFSSFDGVFSAIEQGLCRFGVLPIENSSAGSVNSVYDMMIEHSFHIVRSTRVKVDHSLLAPKGVQLSDIKEVISHEQALAQCSALIKSLGNIKVTECENTAIAAEIVSKTDRRDIAAISSRSCAELYGLSILRDSVQNNGNNHTRFICISKNLEIYPGADKTSIMMVLPHKPGALYKILARFYAFGINLIKLESRPIPERDFEFMFYFDLETSVYSEEFAQLITELDAMSEQFRYLGSYTDKV